MSDDIPRDADDARADDGPPTDGLSDEVKADSASGPVSADTADSADDGDHGSESGAAADVPEATAQVDEPTD